MWLTKSVIPECNIDSNLFNVLLQFGKDGVNHTKGNTTVVKKVKEKFDDLFCIAVIDKDRRDILFINEECHKIDIGEFDQYFQVYKRKGKANYFIQIVPVIETWIWNTAIQLNVILADFEIVAESIEELKRFTKKVDSKNDDRFRRLFKEFVKRAEENGFEPLVKLKKVVTYLLEKQYQLDTNDLKNV